MESIGPSDDLSAAENVRQSLMGVWRPADAPLIFASVLSKQWHLVDMLLGEEEHHRHLGYADSYGYTVLHYASWESTVPLHVVEKMVAFGPANFVCRGTIPKGRTPLHFAAWSGRDDVVLLLLEKCPEAASILDQSGKSPLCDACTRNRSVDVLRALANADPKQISITNKWGRTPAMTFFRIWHGWVCNSYRSRMTEESKRREYVEKVEVILEAEYRDKHGSDIQQFDHRLLIEAAIESPTCPPYCVKILLEAHVNEISVLRRGSTVLHLALNVAGAGELRPFQDFYKCDKCKMTMAVSAGGSDERSRVFFGGDSSRPHVGVFCESCIGEDERFIATRVRVPVVDKETSNIDAILSLRAALGNVVNERGLKPLFQGLHCGRQWFSGIQSILMADRDALCEQDPETRLFPFMLAATQANDGSDTLAKRPSKRLKVDSNTDASVAQELCHSPTERVHLTTIYRLLLEDPSVLEAALSYVGPRLASKEKLNV